MGSAGETGSAGRETGSAGREAGPAGREMGPAGREAGSADFSGLLGNVSYTRKHWQLCLWHSIELRRYKTHCRHVNVVLSTETSEDHNGFGKQLFH